MMGGLAYLGALYIAPGFLGNKISGTNSSSTVSFAKEGELFFLKNGIKAKKIDIEIAENEEERNKGLMFRSYLPDTTGMLFIFEKETPQNFWMKNTIIPLDIIYVDAEKKIISITKNTNPYSEEVIPSYGDAQYVIEVNTGFTEKHNIQIGDEISF